jgi:hypothetical protein
MTDLNPWLPSMSLHEWQQRQLAILKVQFNYEMIVEKANESDVGRAVPGPIEDGGRRSDADDRGEGQ